MFPREFKNWKYKITNYKYNYYYYYYYYYYKNTSFKMAALRQHNA